MAHPPIRDVTLVVGLEVHVELATRSKMFSRAPSPAHASVRDASPNSLIDPTVFALPGALPVMNRAAIEMAMMVGLALRCSIPPLTRWDRKSYFYPDLPKGYQISQYDLPLCFDGAFDLPEVDAGGFPDFSRPARRIGIIRAHLEEDAGKLLHEAPGGFAIDHSLVDENRAGTPLLEVVTQPDFRNADEVVLFARMFRNVCRFLGVTEGVMQKGHVRFEPNINCHLALNDGTLVRTPIVEIKNLNSFRALRGAIEFEAADQPRRWMRDGRVQGRGTKVTRGWDEAQGVTVVQREKEDAHDYRYFPDPDLPPVRVDDAWKERVAARLAKLPADRLREYMQDFALGVREASALTDERDVCLFFERAVDALRVLGVERPRAGKIAANLVLQSGQRIANERGVLVSELGISPEELGALAAIREEGRVGNQAVEELVGALATPGRALSTDPGEAKRRVEAVAAERGLIVVQDEGAIESWVAAVLDANATICAEVRAGRVQAAGRLVGEVMKASGGRADAKTVRAIILRKLGVG